MELKTHPKPKKPMIMDSAGLSRFKGDGPQPGVYTYLISYLDKRIHKHLTAFLKDAGIHDDGYILPWLMH